MIEVIGLVVVVLGLALGVISIPFASLFLVAYGYGLVLTRFTLVLDEVTYHRNSRISDRLLLVMWTILENFGYRQLTVYWRLKGIIKYVQGKTDWGAMERKGFQTIDTP